jgi:CheY-like chemotaxis protein
MHDPRVQAGSNDTTPGPLVLVVDDESAYRELERRILERGGYRVIEASGGLEACRMLEGPDAPDLLIADLDMPDLPGEEMVRRIHTIRPELKVLYVTANIDRLLDAQSIAWEGEAFLDKPFTPKGLLEAVSLLLTGTLSGPSRQSQSSGAI